MKTLILVGSPNKNGNTMKMVQSFASNLKDEYEILDIYHMNIHTCMDCHICQKNNECKFEDDEFKTVRKKIKEADCIVLATPVWFANMCGPMLTALSRLTFLENEYIYKERKHVWNKAGVLLLSTGTRWIGMSKPIELNAEFFFMAMDALPLTSVYANHTDILKTCENPLIMKRCEYASKLVNQFMEDKKTNKFYHYGIGSIVYDELEDLEWIKNQVNL